MKGRFVGLAAILLIVIAVPFILPSSDTDLILRSFLLASAAIGLQILMSYAGQISLGNGAFMGMGAYITGILSAKYGVPSVLSIPCAVAGTALIALIVGYPILRLKGHYLALGTLAVGIAVTSFINTMYSITGGPAGLTGIPGIGWGSVELTGKTGYYFLAVLVFLCIYGYSSNLLKTRVGRALVTMKSGEHTAEAMGVQTSKIKVQVFIMSAVFASFSGAVLAHYMGIIVPSQFDLLISIELLIMILLGGEKLLIGSLIGALVWGYLGEFTQNLEIPRSFIVGFVIILLILAFKDGIAPTVLKMYRKYKGAKGTEGAIPSCPDEPVHVNTAAVLEKGDGRHVT